MKSSESADQNTPGALFRLFIVSFAGVSVNWFILARRILIPHRGRKQKFSHKLLGSSKWIARRRQNMGSDLVKNVNFFSIERIVAITCKSNQS